MSTSSFRRENYRSMLLLSLLLFIPLGVGVAGLIQAYLKSVGAELMNSWLQTEAVKIQEGNLLTSVTNNRRVLLSSQIVTSIVLYDQSDGGRRHSMIEFGDAVSESLDVLDVPVGKVVLESLGLLHEQVVYRFPEQSNLILMFDLKPKLAWVVLFGVQSIAFMFLLAAMALLSRAKQKEEESRVMFLRSAINELMTQANPSSELLSQFPLLSTAWKSLKDTIDKLAQELASQSVNAAIAQTTQMLAHDMRQPFTQLQVGLHLLEGCRTIDEFNETISQVKTVVGKSVANVSALISDVMAIGSSSTELVLEKALLNDVTISAFDSVSKLYPHAQRVVERVLESQAVISVDAFKLQRVMCNLMNNAFEATEQGGRIWLRTRDVYEGVEFCIGNGGSFIAPNDVQNLFDAYFTRGKKGGTGLGLAIAKKYVALHGGKIWCESRRTIDFPEGQVEFFFVLPRPKD